MVPQWSSIRDVGDDAAVADAENDGKPLPLTSQPEQWMLASRQGERVTKRRPVPTEDSCVRSTSSCLQKTSISCRQLTRATKSYCRQRLTISAINYSGRASELGGIINLVDRRRSSLSRCDRRHLSRAKLITSSIDMPWQNF